MQPNDTWTSAPPAHGHHSAWIAPEPELPARVPAPAWLAAAESLALAAAFLLAGRLVDRGDPFLLAHPLPWLALAPLLAGLRHGASMGLLSGGALGVALWAASAGLPWTVFEAAAGWMAVGLLAGESRDAWRRRSRELEGAAADLRARLEDLARQHAALEASHESLRRQIPGDPATLRDALASLERAFGARSGPVALEVMGDALLALLAEFASVQSASLHPVDAVGAPGKAIASLGAGGGREDDPLLAAAIRSGCVTSVRSRGEGSELLAAVPLVDVRRRVHAVVAVRDMPFVALHEGTLNLLAVIGACLGEAVAGPPERAVTAEPSVPPEHAALDPAVHGGPGSRAIVRVEATLR